MIFMNCSNVVDEGYSRIFKISCQYPTLASTCDILRVSPFHNFTDTIWISAPYRILKYCVKLEARKMRFWNNKEGKSIGSDSPFWVWISSSYPKCILRVFRPNHVGIYWRRCPIKKGYPRFLGASKSFD